MGYLDVVVGGDDGGDFVQVVERSGEEEFDGVVRQSDDAQLTQATAFEQSAADGRQFVALQADITQLVQMVQRRCWYHC